MFMFVYLIYFWVNIQATLNSDGGILHREFWKEAVFMTPQHLGKGKIANYAISTYISSIILQYVLMSIFSYDGHHITHWVF